MKIAVVGTGAAGLGVLSTLLDSNLACDITIFDPARKVQEPPTLVDDSAATISSFYDGLYKDIRKQYPRKFPPPKTHFAEQIPRQSVGGRLKIFKSDTFGGLTNFWGATMLPFTSREFSEWPITLRDMELFYRRIADIVGISAEADRLNEYFGIDYATRPAIKPTVLLSRLDSNVNESTSKGAFRILSGVNRCALETREDHDRSCVYCGECMLGCFRDSIYSTRQTISEFLRDPRIAECVGDPVVRVVESDGCAVIEMENRSERMKFDKVFLCAGCCSTTEILMRSTGLTEGPVLKDNAVYVFPIIYTKTLPRSVKSEPYLSLCNLILACIPESRTDHFAQAQIYPNFDYLWRYNIPTRLWPLFRLLFGFLRHRVFWGRLYVHSDHSQSYSVSLQHDKLSLDVASQPKRSPYITQLMAEIRKTLTGKGFFVPRGALVRQKTNSHYVGTFPYNDNLLNIPPNGEAMRGVYVCDATCFPSAPAINPTFSIMANAARTTALALSE
jgi:ferredoxin